MEEIVQRRLLDTHRETVVAVVAAGRTVADAWPDESVSDPDAITTPLERILQEQQLTGPLLSLLDTGATAAGGSVQGDPVPAPPYVAFTSRGPICRATLSDGSRLVIELELFAVDRAPRQYRFLDPDPDACLGVHIR